MSRAASSPQITPHPSLLGILHASFWRLAPNPPRLQIITNAHAHAHHTNHLPSQQSIWQRSGFLSSAATCHVRSSHGNRCQPRQSSKGVLRGQLQHVREATATCWLRALCRRVPCPAGAGPPLAPACHALTRGIPQHTHTPCHRHSKPHGQVPGEFSVTVTPASGPATLAKAARSLRRPGRSFHTPHHHAVRFLLGKKKGVTRG